uniref:Uncharacterized protein n=1 Tax=Arundo donax TaxID=35708 RepID=A0A0A8Y7K3_ARUDO
MDSEQFFIFIFALK